MASYQATQSEKIVIEKDCNEMELNFITEPKLILIQVRDKTGVEKPTKLDRYTLSISGTKATFKAGDVVSYIAIM